MIPVSYVIQNSRVFLSLWKIENYKDIEINTWFNLLRHYLLINALKFSCQGEVIMIFNQYNHIIVVLHVAYYCLSL